MKRGGWLRRYTRLRSTTRPGRNRARMAVRTGRAHGSPEFRAWMKRQPCAVCGRTPSDAAHLTNGGMGRKDDVARTVPLCSDNIPAGYAGHHTEYDGGKRSFRARYASLDLEATAAATHALWLAR